MTYPSDHKDNKQVIDVETTPVQGNEPEAKASFTERHAKGLSRLKTVGKVLAGVGTVIAAVVVGEKIADSGRTYYQIDLYPRKDGTQHLEDVNPDLIDKDTEPVIMTAEVEELP